MSPLNPNETAQITTRIARLNDAFRRAVFSRNTDHVSERSITLSQGVCAFSPEDVTRIFERINLYNAFTKANDPYGEHDFGRLEYHDETLYWKIEYHDPALEYQHEYDEDLASQNRKLTIMLSHEW